MSKFEPKHPQTLQPPKNDVIDLEELAKYDGTNAGYGTYVAIKGTVFDVSGNKAYEPGAGYNGIAPLLQDKHCILTDRTSFRRQRRFTGIGKIVLESR